MLNFVYDIDSRASQTCTSDQLCILCVKIEANRWSENHYSIINTLYNRNGLP